MRKIIGGNLEYQKAKNFSENMLSRNIKQNLFLSGRSAFLGTVKYMFKKKNINKIEIPCFLCKSIVTTLKKNKINYTFYKIDKNFNLKPNLKKNVLTLLVNYFSINTKNIEKLILNNKNHSFILDASHVFLNNNFNFKPEKNLSHFYSLRKFSPIIAGGSSVSNINKKKSLKYEKIFKENINLKNKRQKYFQSKHGKINNKFENFMVKEFLKHESIIAQNDNLRIPKILPNFINTVNWELIRSKRRRNFTHIFKLLKKKFTIVNYNNLQKHVTPLFLILDVGEKRNQLRKYLFSKRIFAPIHWSKIKHINYKNYKIEKKMSENFLSIPIDQRYNLSDMNYIYKNLIAFKI